MKKTLVALVLGAGLLTATPASPLVITEIKEEVILTGNLRLKI